MDGSFDLTGDCSCCSAEPGCWPPARRAREARRRRPPPVLSRRARGRRAAPPPKARSAPWPRDSTCPGGSRSCPTARPSSPSARPDRVLRMPHGGGAITPLITLPGVNTGGTAEGGLLGLAVSPDYGTDGLLFAYFTTDSDNRIVSFTADGGAAERHSLILTGLKQGNIHNGGRIGVRPRRQALRRRRRDRRAWPRPGPLLEQWQDPADQQGRQRPVGQPVPRLAGVELRPPQRSGVGVGFGAPNVGLRIRPKPFRRGQFD